MATLVLESSARNAGADAIVALLDSGDIEFQTAGGNEVATCALSATAFGGAVAGVCTANAISDDTAATGGTIAQYVLKTSGGATIATGDVTVTGGGGSVTMDDLTIGAGGKVEVSAFTFTLEASI